MTDTCISVTLLYYRPALEHMCREGVLEHIFDRLFLTRENSTILIVELLLLEQLMGSSRDLIALVV